VNSHEERKATRREEQKRKKELTQVEEHIEVLEQELAVLTTEMQDPAMAVDHARLSSLIEKHSLLQEELDGCMERWETLQEVLAEGEVS
jgi:ATP-binding cassette subfamily F protein 3